MLARVQNDNYMDKVQYYPSPLRKDYNTKKGLDKVLPSNLQNSAPAKKSIIRESTSDKSPISKSKTSRYLDGLLVEDQSGEGRKLFFMTNQGVILFSQNSGLIIGNVYIIYAHGLSLMVPFASRVHNYIDGWVISLSRGNFIQFHFYKQGKREGAQYFYDVSEHLLVESTYAKNQLRNISNGVKGDLQELLLSKNNQLKTALKNFQENIFIFGKEDSGAIQSIDNLTYFKNKFKYYGEVEKTMNNSTHSHTHSHSRSNSRSNSRINQVKNTENVPHGYGVMLSESQLYMGNFNFGVLNGLGCIQFNTKGYYFGELNQGSCRGYGISCLNGEKKYLFDQDIIDKGQFQGFITREQKIDVNQCWLSKKGQALRDIVEVSKQLLLRVGLFYKKTDDGGNSENAADQDGIKRKSSRVHLDFQDQSVQSKRRTPKLGNRLSFGIPKLVINREERLSETERPEINESYSPRTNLFHTEPKQKIVILSPINNHPNASSVYMHERQEYLGCEQLGKDKWYVSKEGDCIQPRRQTLQVKKMFKKSAEREDQFGKLDKNEYPQKIKYGKIRKTSSNLTPGQSDKFFRKWNPEG